MLQVGFDNRVNHLKVLAITQVGAKPIRDQIQIAREENKLIDCTKGRTTRSVIYLEDGYVILSAVAPDRLASRWNGELLRRTREDVAISEDDLKVGGGGNYKYGYKDWEQSKRARAGSASDADRVGGTV